MNHLENPCQIKNSNHRIGLGVTALARGNLTGHIDGIGVYTQALLSNWPQSNPVVPVVIGRRFQDGQSNCQLLPIPYSINVAASAFFRVPFIEAKSLERKIDLFHATDHYIPRLTKVPVISTVHDIIGIRHPEWVNPNLRYLKNWIFKRSVLWSQKIITISEYSANDISEWLGIDRSKIAVIPQGVSDSNFYRFREDEIGAIQNKYQVGLKSGLSEGYFIAIGTLQPRKNIERLIRAHALLSLQLRRAFPLVVVGGDGWLTDDLKPLLAELQSNGFGKWLRYLPQPDLQALLQSATALVFPSLAEGFGLPVLEGFANQVPVIASNTTSIPEVAGDAALLVDPLSEEQISYAMHQLITDQQLRAELVQRGCVRVRGFSWEATAKKTHDVYREVLG